MTSAFDIHFHGTEPMNIEPVASCWNALGRAAQQTYREALAARCAR
jgi:hypothetical protein